MLASGSGSLSREKWVLRVVGLAVWLIIAVAPSAMAEAPSPVPVKPDLTPGPNKGQTDSDNRVPSRYIVIFEDSVKAPVNLAEAQTEPNGRELGFVYTHALKGYSAELSKSAVEVLREDPRVKAVRPDHKLVAASQTIPTGIERVNATENSTADIDGANDAPVNVDVAVIDSGVDHNHDDLNVVARTYCNGSIGSATCTDNTGTDELGHGTHVAGTIGAIDNGIGVVGVAPGARIWSVKVFDPGVWESEIVAGINWVTARASQIEVANMSIGCVQLPCDVPSASEAISTSVSAGVAYVVAAGNNSSGWAKYSDLASHPDVISVSALSDYDGKPGADAEPLTNGGGEECEATDPDFNFGDDDVIAWFSNKGEEIDVAAPGVCILSTVPGDKYDFSHGTSMASPHVAGAAALLAATSNPSSKASVEAIRQQIVEEGSQNWTDRYLHGGGELNGKNSIYGEDSYAPDGVQEPLLDVGPQAPATYSTRAIDISLTEATVNGGANPDGASSSYWFEYGTSTGYGQSAPVAPKSLGYGPKDLKVSENLDDLKPGTTYHFRLATIDEETEDVTYGEDETFETQRAVFTTEATGVDATAARLEGEINPAGKATSYQFEWGTSTAYGNSAPVSPKAIGSGNEFISISEQVEGLKANTTYHFRVVATRGVETIYGEEETFTTNSSAFVAEVDNVKILAVSDNFQEFSFGHAAFDPPAFSAICEPMYVGTTKSGPFESFASEVDPDPSCSSHNGYKSPLELNNCELSFHPGPHDVREEENGELIPLVHYKGSLGIGGPDCDGMGLETFINGNFCDVTIPPQGNIAARFYEKGTGSNAIIDVEVLDQIKSSGSGGIGCRQGLSNWSSYVTHWTIWAEATENPVGLNIVDNYRLPPLVTTEPASAVNASQATLHGKVTPQFLSTTYQVEYVDHAEFLESSWENGTSAPASPKAIGSGSAPVAVSEKLEGLDPRTTYHYRVVATNSEGTTYGEGMTFTTWGDWSLQTTTNPDPLPLEARFDDVSCPSATVCMAVGENKQKAAPHLAVWNGSTWGTVKATSFLSLRPIGASVSCASASSCMVVGPVVGGSPAAEAWTESSGTWSGAFPQTPPAPEGASEVKLNDVSCSSTSACTAVGSYAKEGKTKTLAVRWNGSSWSTQTTPNPETGNAELLAVSCEGASSCTAVGTQGAKTLALRWNGSTWSTSTTPNPEGATESRLDDVSCTSAGFCMAIGRYKSGGANSKTLALRWNGSAWTVVSTPNPAEAIGTSLLGVSCASSTACTAVGRAVITGSAGLEDLPTEEKTLALSWGGSEWATQSSPNPEGKKLARLNGVSCSAAGACTAVGSAKKSSGEAEMVTLGERYE